MFTPHIIFKKIAKLIIFRPIKKYYANTPKKPKNFLIKMFFKIIN